MATTAGTGAGAKAARPGRVAWIDAGKGVGILFVVLGHVMDGLFTASVMRRDGIAGLVFFGIYTFHMPLFFFLAGLTAKAGIVADRGRFITSKLQTIVYPYFLWSVIQGSTQVMVSSNLNRATTASDVLNVWSHPIGHFWFLYALFICHLVAAFLGLRPGLLLCTAALGLLLYPYAPGVLFSTFYYFAFYAIGLQLGTLKALQAPNVGGTALLALGLFFVGSAALFGWLGGWRPIGLMMLPVSILGVVTVICLCQMLRGRVLRLAAALGTMSMTIYLLHVMAAAGARVALTMLGVHRLPMLYLMIGTASGILVPVLAHLLFRHFGLLPAFGLATRRRAPTGSPRLAGAG